MRRTDDDFPRYAEAPGRRQCPQCEHWQPRYYIGSRGVCVDCYEHGGRQRVRQHRHDRASDSITLAAKRAAVASYHSLDLQKWKSFLSNEARIAVSIFEKGYSVTQVAKSMGVKKPTMIRMLDLAYAKFACATKSLPWQDHRHVESHDSEKRTDGPTVGGS